MKQSQLQAAEQKEQTALAQLVRSLNQGGHNPATSGNYSLRSQARPGFCLVSESGVDKALFKEENLLWVDQRTGGLEPSLAAQGKKPSDETLVHLGIYKVTGANCILHSHLLESLLFAELHPKTEVIWLEGLELLKGFAGVKTHEAKIPLFCFENTQDIGALSARIEADLVAAPQTYGLLLRGHGLYVWGNSVKEAKRHLEVFEYLFRYYVHLNRIKP
ncbi:MAG: methylthioribulose-1-phosphate dehydratase [Candidatus Lambdaproteobacteria bacterium RIFOXYD1_FULL_56_27]|uniref:Methylthioribulose-1-phosphate dehydratase n=1 Tax=Candidatus Lambdaproteobacteria bacterium RIFOXYD2_FULL_56_26 TaxID=1817773 RepID=A0A1F6GRL7_9PROT|nr:MAG: methylthioribulose-1-phosphate dehydratase [Candidatus Lambdaproteobacteria bacterium RIFOXYC1_FULL_56_13]OGH00709.1 MAG: methylthioribulose-1-phosphate dehydratase [Candidatus Lambdaproteobacteria bacterium RIFOXYD2_FULL_56_26]OGH07876.1 MAG: methylthioribulose-1-phosphate dehydratase [Candidatus Lambdaproteobacteria bacterium RIFOXYD1_FULL_56_27]